MIGFLRFIGVMNAAVWLGAAVFYTVGVGPALNSGEMQELLGETYFPYFSGAIVLMVSTRYFHLSIACGVVALLHLLAEWLYMGRPARKFSFSLLAGLLGLALVGGIWFQPILRERHKTRYYAPQPPTRVAADKSFKAWHTLSQLLNLAMIGGLIVYVWRVTHPPDTLRFVSSVKFRG